MVPTGAEIINILMRWMHITSAIVLVGGILFARAVAAPLSVEFAKPGEQPALMSRFMVRFRPLVNASIVGLIVSGVYNLLSNRGHTPYYHMLFGIKVLLALHVFAAAALAVRPAATAADEEKRRRRMTGVVISGLVIALIGAYLRRIY